MGAVRPQHREEQPRRRLLRRPEPEDPSPAAAQETHPVSEVRSISPRVIMLISVCYFPKLYLQEYRNTQMEYTKYL